jgi:hypothetical protein
VHAEVGSQLLRERPFISAGAPEVVFMGSAAKWLKKLAESELSLLEKRNEGNIDVQIDLT